MDFEPILKLAVNYGLGSFFAIGIAIVFFCHLRDEKKLSIAREERLMTFIETHMTMMQKTIDKSSDDAKTVAAYQRTEHESMISVLTSIQKAFYKMQVKLEIAE